METAAWGLPSGQGWLSPSTLAWGDLLFLLLRAGASRAVNGNSLFGMLCWDTGAEAVGQVFCSCYKAPWRCRLMAVAMSLGGSMVLAREGGSTSAVGGTWMSVVLLSDCTLLRSTSISLWSIGRFARGSSIPKWQFLEGKLQGFKLAIETFWAYHYLLLLL